jgi:MA3 domain
MNFSGVVKKEPSAPTKPMSQDDIDKNYNAMLAIVNGYRDDKFTLEEAIAKLKPLAISKEVLVEIYNKFLDRKDIDRENLMLVVCELLRTKKVTRDDNRAALITTMELAPDMMCDVPRVYEYIGQFMGESLNNSGKVKFLNSNFYFHFIAELIIASVLTFQEVHQILEADLATQGESMLRFIFVATEKRHGPQRLQQIVGDTNCDLGNFISDGNYSRWLEDNVSKKGIS